MKIRAWKVLDRGNVPTSGANETSYTCFGCGNDSRLPVVGTVIAQLRSGPVFERPGYATPALIECRHCRRRYGLEPERAHAPRAAEALAS